MGRSSSSVSKRIPSARSSSTRRLLSSSANHSAIAAARSGPMPSQSVISSCVAEASRSTVPKCRARFCAVTQPTSGMFRPKSTRRNGISFDAAIDLTVFVAEISANPSSSSSCSFVSL